MTEVYPGIIMASVSVETRLEVAGFCLSNFVKNAWPMNLFAALPEDIFKPLAAQNRRFYAALLLHLYDHVFGEVCITPRRAEVIDAVAHFLTDYECTVAALAEEGMEDDRGRKDAQRDGKDPRAYFTFYYLVRSGWLIEQRDNYRKLVDLTPEARLILRELHRIANGDTRSYGGAVLNVLNNLRGAKDKPSDGSLGIRNAAQFSRDFQQHLRTLAAVMQRIENTVLAQTSHRDLFEAFFGEFIERCLITDYKTLHTRNNPFRFRSNVLEMAHQLYYDELGMELLAQAYVDEGRAPDTAAATRIIRQELDEISRVFGSIEDSLKLIDYTKARIERRMHMVIRYMDRPAGGRLERATEALRVLAAFLPEANDLIPVDTAFYVGEPLFGPEQLYRHQERRPPIGRSTIRTIVRDPAIDRFNAAKREWARRIQVTSDRMLVYIERNLGDKAYLAASEFEICDVDDFLCYQRLRELPHLFGGKLAQRYRLERQRGMVTNDWLDHTDFIIHRKVQEPAR